LAKDTPLAVARWTLNERSDVALDYQASAGLFFAEVSAGRSERWEEPLSHRLLRGAGERLKQDVAPEMVLDKLEDLNS
jgi:hypothetical protein